MIIHFTHRDTKYSADLSNGLDISIPLKSGALGPKCFYAPDFKVEPVIAGDFIGSIEQGSPVNFKNILVNPHGNGTHTECAGHITAQPFTINGCLKEFHFIARLVTIVPDVAENGDKAITVRLLERDHFREIEAAVIRTVPNDTDKLVRDYSGTNPPYFNAETIHWLNDCGIKHIITDLPSIDREEDGGALVGHRAFWGYPDFPDLGKTITEMVYVPDSVEDGLYFCNIQIASIESDASPSKVMLYNMLSTD